MLATKMTTSDKIINFITAFILSLAVVVTIAFTFLHEYYPLHSKKYIKHKASYKNIIIERDVTYDRLNEKLAHYQITPCEFNNLFVINKEKYKCQVANFKSIKKEIESENSVLGYWSYKTYLLTIGLPFLGLFNALLLLFLVMKKVKDGSQKVFYLIIAFVLIITWGYWVAWSNLNHTQDPNRPGDFPRIFYNIALYVLPIILFIITYFTFKSYNTVKEKIASTIYMFNTLMWIDLPDKNLIHPEKDKEYRRLRLDLTRKAQKNA